MDAGSVPLHPNFFFLSGTTRWRLCLPLVWCMRLVVTATASWAQDYWGMPEARFLSRPAS